MKKFALCLCAAAVALAGCTRIDDLEQKVDDLDSRVQTLEETVASINEQIAALDALVKTIQDGGYIKDVTVETKDGINYYTLTLSNGSTYTVRDGAKGIDGKDGHTPVIGVKLDEDGLYYWTVDGNFTDPKVRANGQDGQTPAMSVTSGYLVITWPGQEPQYYQVQGEPGKDGDAFFQKVDVNEDDVVFTLADGTSFTVSLIGNFRLVCPSTTVGVNANSTATIKYAVKGVLAEEEVVVYVKYVSAGWAASVDEAASELKIEVPADPQGGLVIIEAINNTTSQVADQAIRFENGVLSAATLSYEISDGANTIEVPVSTNMSYDVTVDAEWLTLVQTRAPHTETLVFAAELNEGAEDRSASIVIEGATGDVVKIVVLQRGCPALKDKYEIGEFYERQGVVGVVFHFDENVVKVLALDDKKFINFADYATANSLADSKTDGFANQKKILDNQYSDITWFPAHNWCYSKGAGWYLPAEDEMAEILNNMDVLNSTINAHDGNSLIKGYYYWSSTQNTSTREAVTVCWDWDYGKAISTPKDPTIASYTARAAYNVNLKEDEKPEEEPLAIGKLMELDNGKGVVAYIDETGKSGYVVSIGESDLMHYASSGEDYTYWPTSETDYQDNYDRITEWYGLPSLAQSWASQWGNAGWRVPAKEQLLQIFRNRTALNTAIEAAGGTPIHISDNYWSSTSKIEDGVAKTFYYSYCWGDTAYGYTPVVNGYEGHTRAIHKFIIE